MDAQVLEECLHADAEIFIVAVGGGPDGGLASFAFPVALFRQFQVLLVVLAALESRELLTIFLSSIFSHPNSLPPDSPAQTVCHDKPEDNLS